jgi:hypothetical protein
MHVVDRLDYRPSYKLIRVDGFFPCRFGAAAVGQSFHFLVVLSTVRGARSNFMLENDRPHMCIPDSAAHPSILTRFPKEVIIFERNERMPHIYDTLGCPPHISRQWIHIRSQNALCR